MKRYCFICCFFFQFLFLWKLWSDLEKTKRRFTIFISFNYSFYSAQLICFVFCAVSSLFDTSLFFGNFNVYKNWLLSLNYERITIDSTLSSCLLYISIDFFFIFCLLSFHDLTNSLVFFKCCCDNVLFFPIS